MKFLCLLYGDEAEREAIPPSKWETLMQESFAVTDDLRARGLALAGAALQPVRTAITLRRKRGERSVTDGPFMETKEQLGGFLMIEAADLEAATELALKLPILVLGSMEIRPVWEREDILARRVTGTATHRAYSAATHPRRER